jgi:hypothetical protein
LLSGLASLREKNNGEGETGISRKDAKHAKTRQDLCFSSPHPLASKADGFHTQVKITCSAKIESHRMQFYEHR